MLNLLALLIINTPNELHTFTLASSACTGLDVSEAAVSVGNVCIYSLGEHGWYYFKEGKAHGATCTLSEDTWCEGFLTKEEAIKHLSNSKERS